MTEFKKHDPVYFHTDVTGKAEKVYGYVQKRLAGIYFVIDNAGKEWVQYPEDLYRVKVIGVKQESNARNYHT